MSRQITGTLRNPDGTVLGSQTIRFISLRNSSPSILKSITEDFSTAVDGSYDVTVENGTYSAHLISDNSPALLLGEIAVEDGTAIDLVALLILSGGVVTTLGTVVSIEDGGSGENNIVDARTAFDVYSKAESDALLNDGTY